MRQRPKHRDPDPVVAPDNSMIPFARMPGRIVRVLALTGLLAEALSEGGVSGQATRGSLPHAEVHGPGSVEDLPAPPSESAPVGPTIVKKATVVDWVSMHNGRCGAVGEALREAVQGA